jgi:hypothetical protein
MRNHARFVSAVLAASVLHTSLPAYAQSTNQEAPTLPAPPDIVRMKNGGFVRGTILESVPNDHVDVQLQNGQVKRIPWSDVAYAGSASAEAPRQPPPAVAPPPPPPNGTPAADEAPVKFEADGGDELRLHARVGQSEFVGYGWSGRGAVVVSGIAHEYASLCVAPCNARMPLGTHRLALSMRGGRAIESVDAVRIDGPSLLRGHYESYAGTRAAGWIIMLSSLVVGTVVMVTARKDTQDCSVGPNYCFTTTEIDGTQFAVGAGIMLVGGLFGLVMALKRDEASFTVSPLSIGAPRYEGRALWAGAPAEGLSLKARF